MRDGIRELLAATFGRVVSGAAEAQVYARWRELTRPCRRREGAVRAAGAGTDPDSRWRRRSRPPSPAAAPTARTTMRGASVTDVVVAFDSEPDVTRRPCWLELVLAKTHRGALRLWVLARGLSDAYQEWLAAAFPAVPDHVPAV